MIRRAVCVAILTGFALLAGCGYSVVEEKQSIEMGVGDTYVAPYQTQAMESDE